MSEEQSQSSRLGEWMVMSLEEGFHAYDKTSGLKWPPERSTAGVNFHHVWRDGWNAPPAKKQGSWLSRLVPQPRETEREYREAHFEWVLATGQAEAIGYRLPRRETDRPVLIPEEAWEKCRLCWKTATLSGGGFEFGHVRILMPERSALLKNGLYFLDQIPPLERFEPSEADRIRKGIPVALEIDGPLAAQNNQPGRPSNKAAILDAFSAIEKNPNWNQKELTNSVREHVLAEHGLQSDDGLSHKTIMRHVEDLWSDFKGQKP